ESEHAHTDREGDEGRPDLQPPGAPAPCCSLIRCAVLLVGSLRHPRPFALGSHPTLQLGRALALENFSHPQACSPSATICSGSRSLLPYMKWFSIRPERRLASVTRPSASATSRLWMGVAPHRAPR